MSVKGPADPDKVQAIRGLLEEGRSWQQIATTLGITKAAAGNLIRRHILGGRSKTVKDAFQPAPKPQPTLRAVLPVPMLSSSIPVFAHPFCQWPIGWPRSKGFRFCDAPSAAGYSYCTEHCARAYVRWAA